MNCKVEELFGKKKEVKNEPQINFGELKEDYYQYHLII